VQVWGRLAEDEEDSLAIMWLHQPYKQGFSIKQSELTGKMGQIGRLWHRMYPRFRKTQNKEGNVLWKPTEQYAELLTIFPNVTGNEQEQEKTRNFLKFLHQETDFKQLW
jgi:CRISPR-associated protein Cmr6